MKQEKDGKESSGADLKDSDARKNSNISLEGSEGWIVDIEEVNRVEKELEEAKQEVEKKQRKL